MVKTVQKHLHKSQSDQKTMKQPFSSEPDKRISNSVEHIKVKDRLSVNIQPERITRALLTAAFFLAMLSLSAQLFKYLGNSENGRGLIPMMDVDRESSVPSIFSVQLLFIAALLFMLISMLKHLSQDKFRWHWTGLAAGFTFMTFDEGASIHELLTMPIRNIAGEGLPSFLTFAWVIPIGILVIFLAFVYIKFILALPKETRRMIIISAMLYLGGALGVEMIGGSYAHSQTIHNLPYNIMVTIEEMLEMAGTIFLILTLANYLKYYYGSVEIKIQP